MRDSERERRSEEILDAAFAVLQEKGYRGATMLAVARRAGASKETLYAWFGDKPGLFRALVEANAREVRGILAAALAEGAGLEETLAAFGPALLRLLLGERAVAINRAAAVDADETGTLGAALAAAGRESVLPLLVDLLTRARDEGRLAFDDATVAAEAYLGLLLGDRAVRRIIGVAPAPGEDEIARRAEAAAGLFFRLFGVEDGV